MCQTTLAELKNPAPLPQNVAVSMDTVAGFESMQRVAKLFASSSIVPKQYQGNIADCFIAVDMAMRIGANPLMTMQNLYIVHGNPAWSAQFLIATFNRCGRFSALRYEFEGEQGKDDWGCRAVATELATREKLIGPLVTIGLAKREGWHGKTGSKWQTMPEMMLRYRAAAWFVRLYAPEIAMGLHTVEEEQDRVITVEAVSEPESAKNETSLAGIKKPKRKAPKAAAPEEDVPGDNPDGPAQESAEAAGQEPPGDVYYPCPHFEIGGSPRRVTAFDCGQCERRDDCEARVF